MRTERHTRVFPGREANGDALDLLCQESTALRMLMRKWEETDPQEARDHVIAAWDHGIIGKLFVEHGSMLVAAEDFIGAALEDAGQGQLASSLTERTARIRDLVDKLYEESRGSEPIPLVRSQSFVNHIGEMEDLLGEDLAALAKLAPEIDSALGDDRADLPSASWVRKRSPSHRHSKGARHPWSVRIQTVWEHLRGHPWVPRQQADRILGRGDAQQG